MIYDIRHVTDYVYETPVSSAKLALRLTPRDGHGQHCQTHALHITPQPSALSTERDFFGNEVTIATIDHPMSDLTVEMRARVEVSRPASLAAGMSPVWDDIRNPRLVMRPALRAEHRYVGEPLIRQSATRTLPGARR